MALRGAFDDLALPVTSFMAEYQITNTALASGALPAAAFTGATFNVINSSVATALTTPTAAAIYAQLVSVLQAAGLPVPQQNIANSTFFENGGPTWEVRISSSVVGPLVVTGGTGVTIVGTASIAQNTSIDFILALTSPTTATLTRIGSGAV
jgi:hypothetical protein